MDWKYLAEQFAPMTCVLSVEKKPDGSYGTIRIETGNQSYIDSLALAAGGVVMDSDERTEFVPGSEYTRYIPKDLNFEDACCRCAVLKQPQHNLIRAARYPFDINIFFMPMMHEEDGKAFCTYSQELIPKSDDNLTTMNISRDIAANVISTCIKLSEDRPFREIMYEVIEDIRGICGADFCCALLMDENNRKCSVLGEARAEGSDQEWMESYLDDDFYGLAETWLDTIGGSYCLVIQDDKDMEYVRERNPQWHESLTNAGVKRLVIFPLMSRGRFLGYIWATNFNTEDTLHIKDTLELTTYFIASEIASNQFIEKLEVMSRIDQLTGVMNRNEMNNRVTELSETNDEASCTRGVVFVDMNGLKQVNDRQGHMAGDLLLKNAAMILSSTFTDGEIYRVGGDEFLILLNDTSADEIEQRIGDIKKKSDMFDNVSFAAGSCLYKKSSEIRSALAEADAMMYRDKERHYKEIGK